MLFLSMLLWSCKSFQEYIGKGTKGKLGFTVPKGAPPECSRIFASGEIGRFTLCA